MNNLNGVVLIGPPGSGKSGIGRHVANAFDGMVYVSSGDIAREMASDDAETRDMINGGMLAPEDKMRDILYRKLYSINVNNREFILDGFPRNIDQLRWLAVRFPKLLFYCIVVQYDECVRRLIERKRQDDTINTIEKRLRYYFDETLPIVGFTSHLRVDNNGDQTVAMRTIVEDIEERVYAQDQQF